MAKCKELKFELWEIQQARNMFQQYSTELHDERVKLSNAMKSLREQDWRGKAADKLVEVVGEDWGKGVDTYCALMDRLISQMDEIVMSYDELQDEALRLRLEQ